MFTQRFIGAPQFVRPRSIGQTDFASEGGEKTREMQPLQLPQMPEIQLPQSRTEQAGAELNTMLTQTAAQYQQAEDALSRLWWSQNWPYVAGGAALLGLVGVLIWKKA